MAISINNYQESLALTEFFPLEGVFPSRPEGGPGTGDIPLGAIRTFAGNFGPNGAPEVAGQILPIAQNTEIFSLLGTTYGGNGQQNFALPDLQTLTPIGAGQGAGLGNHLLGGVAGQPEIALTQGQLPPTLGGSGQPIDNEQPSLPITYIIRTTGNFPSPGAGGSKFIGEIVKFAGNFAPEGYLEAAGQLLPITGNEDLFQLIGITYGGDGQNNFRLPDLRGRNVVGASSSTPLGSLVGDDTVPLTNNEIPANVGGGGAPFDNQGPGLALNYIIALQGIFPSQDGFGGAPSDEPFYGEVAVFAGNFAPKGWALCDGQLLPINQNQALFSLLGTMYGGNGITHFALPDLRDRTAIGARDDVPAGTVLGTDDQVVLSSNIPDVEVTGTAAGESIWGADGNDKLHGAGGNDTITGNDGQDFLDGGAGADTMRGLGGHDLYLVDTAGDVVDETGGAGIDTVRSAITFSLSDNARVRGSVERLTLIGNADIDATGNALANILIGNAGANILNGEAGGDTMRGLDGDDTYLVDSASDIVDEAGGSGFDAIQTTVSFSLSNSDRVLGSVEWLILRGSADIGATGASGADILYGNAGDNIVNGLAGHDFLNGGPGADLMRGGAGDDRYVVDNTADVVDEGGAGGSGHDAVRSWVNFSLSDAVHAKGAIEDLTLLGSDNRNGSGNALDNAIQGNEGANTLTGVDGDDFIKGGDGDDTLIGGTGDDWLNGGLGRDDLFGGAGADRFDFNAAEESPVAAGRDIVEGFSRAQGDRIDLSTIDANQRPGAGGNQAFTFIGSESFASYHADHPAVFGMVRFANGILQGNVNGNFAADFQIGVGGVSSLVVGDLFL